MFFVLYFKYCNKRKREELHTLSGAPGPNKRVKHNDYCLLYQGKNPDKEAMFKGSK